MRDLIHTLEDWARENLAMVIIFLILILGATVGLMQPGPMELRVPVQFGPLVMLSWDEQPNTVAYQIQGRYLDGDWESITMVWRATKAQLPMPIGLVQYRIRPWTMKGPRAWSAPTRWLKFLPVPDPPPATEDDPAITPEEMNAARQETRSACK